MARDRLDTLAALRVVAEQGSFTRAAAELGTTQSALSHAIRRLEADLGQRLLARTTRSVAPTAAGAALLARLGPALDEISAALSQLGASAESPAGTVRLTMGRDAAEVLVLPMLSAFHADYPGIRVEIAATDTLDDLVQGRFDGGIRLGDQLEQDMIARLLTLETRPVVAAAPDYLTRVGAPRTPADLAQHICLGYRMQSGRRVMPWRFHGGSGKEDHVIPSGPVFNDGALLRQAAVLGLGLVYLWRHMVEDDLRTGRLSEVLAEHLAPVQGFFLYYPSREVSPAMSIFSDALVAHCRRRFRSE
ncbi:LysR family transcriptional regulator [Falsirhodobacter sp. alg1]|uniref:LysR family transcriptional regulator n=1 Tax=Falsirhodobacter sp. alg1 TaxID=1472418 RepID=UPI0005EDFE95|nr:LysR family transcriptional regulator [Falsirhodobacter sp. alg1]